MKRVCAICGVNEETIQNNAKQKQGDGKRINFLLPSTPHEWLVCQRCGHSFCDAHASSGYNCPKPRCGGIVYRGDGVNSESVDTYLRDIERLRSKEEKLKESLDRIEEKLAATRYEAAKIRHSSAISAKNSLANFITTQEAGDVLTLRAFTPNPL